MSENYQKEIRNEYAGNTALDNPEKSDSKGGGNWGYVIATTTQMGLIAVKQEDGSTIISSAMNKLGVNSESDALALSIIHGMGHLAGTTHPSIDEGFMKDAQGFKLGGYMNGFNGDVVAAIKHTLANFSDVKKAFAFRFPNSNAIGP